MFTEKRKREGSLLMKPIYLICTRPRLHTRHNFPRGFLYTGTHLCNTPNIAAVDQNPKILISNNNNPLYRSHNKSIKIIPIPKTKAAYPKPCCFHGINEANFESL